MSQSYLLAQTSTSLHLLTHSELESQNVYKPPKMTGAKQLNGVEVIGIVDQPLIVQLYEDQKSLDLLRVKSGVVEKVRKIGLKEVMTTIAAPKTTKSTDIAIGHGSGHVSLLNIQTNKRVKSFNPEVLNNLVEWIDFNCNDEYIVVLYENGLVRTFNVKMGVSSERIKVEKIEIATIRYHPTKAHVLGMASKIGGVYIWDSLKKRAIFKDPLAHKAAIRDIQWDFVNPDLVYIGGYDCSVKGIDIRKQSSTLTLKNQHPVNCFNISECGNFITTGNLAGAVHLYDIRNPTEALYERVLCAKDKAKVQRIVMVPGNHESTLQTTSPVSVNISESREVTSEAPVTPNSEINDLIAQAKTNQTGIGMIGSNFSESLSSKSRVSGRRSSIGIGGKRLSADFGAPNLMKYLDVSTESIDSPVSETSKHRRSLQNISDNAIPENHDPISTTPKTSLRVNVLRKVDEIEENENSIIENKENTPFIPNTSHTSTPNIPELVSKLQISNVLSESAQKETPPTITSTINASNNSDTSQILTAINSLHSRLDQMNTRMDQMEEQMKTAILETQFRLQEEHYERFWGIHNTLLLQAGQIKEKIEEVDEGINVVGAYLNLACPLHQGEPVDLPMNPQKYCQMSEDWEKEFEK